MNERMRIGSLLGLSAIVYLNTLANGFAYDDFSFILNNPLVTSPALRGFFVTTGASNLLRPVTFSSFALNWALGNAHAMGYHLLNLLLHAAVTLLLYLVLRKLLEDVPQADTICFAAAALFAVHPIHTEAVASIFGRSEVFAAGFLLAGWLLHLNDRWIPALFCFLLALLSKESAVVFLPLVLAGDFARGKFKSHARYAWLAGLTALYVALLWKTQGGQFEKGIYSALDNPLASLPPQIRIANALRVAWKYIALLFYPANLSYDYSYNAIRLYSNWQNLLPAAAASLAVLGLWLWSVWTRRKPWMLAGAIYLVGFAVTANIVTGTTIMAERLAYLPSAGFCLLLALIWSQVANRKPAAAWSLLTILVLALGTRTIVRNRDWKDSFTLFSHDAKVEPGSARVHRNLGEEYALRGQFDAASAEFQAALRIYPDYTEAAEGYGLAQSRLGYEQEGRTWLERAVSISKKGTLDHDIMEVNLATHLFKFGQTEEALKLLDEEIQERPGYALAWSHRAAIRAQRGEWTAARADAETALRLDSGNQEAQAVMQEVSRDVAGHIR
jgi:protein O-mannosyl-transferase